MGSRVQSTVFCFPELCFLQFSVAQVGLRKQLINNFIFPAWAADFNNHNNNNSPVPNNAPVPTDAVVPTSVPVPTSAPVPTIRPPAAPSQSPSGTGSVWVLSNGLEKQRTAGGARSVASPRMGFLSLLYNLYYAVSVSTLNNGTLFT